ncbi:MAG TPA: Mth938-like domain-containing protein [Burkholderiaceae bacterium]|nr:Mth938-like domain-containing protein [Burkholderiaceae bacterium]
MKLHADPISNLNTVTAYGPGFIEINKVRHTSSLIVTAEEAVQPWPVEDFQALTVEHFEALAQRGPEIVLLGTGSRQRFPHPRVTQPLLRAHIGLEVMSTAAACRTYNILLSEGRRVLAAMLLEY